MVRLIAAGMAVTALAATGSLASGSARADIPVTKLPPSVRARVSVEAAIAQGWREIVGDAGEIVSIEHFGASAPADILYEQFGITADRVVAAAHASLSKVGATSGSTTGN